MSMNVNNLPLAQRLVAIFLLFAILMLSSIVTVLYFQRGSNKMDGVRIDIAGRNRMLSQKAAFLVTSTQATDVVDRTAIVKELTKIRELHQSSFLLLRNGGVANDITLNSSYEQFSKAYDAIESTWTEYELLIDKILAGENGLQITLLSSSQQLLTVNNDLVQAMVGDYNERNLFYQNVFIVQGLLSGIILLFGFAIVRSSIIAPTKKLLQHIGALNEGHFGSTIDLERKDEFGSIGNGINELSEKINGLIGGLNQISNRIVQLSESLQSSAEATTENASSQAASTEEISASLEELDSTSEMNAQRSNDMTNQSLESLRQISEVKSKSQEVVRTLSEISTNILAVDEIASQTNMLALNAAVEASRAGEQGKGFAVISKEVRSLADLSKEASEKIVSLVETCNNSALENNELLDLHVTKFHEFIEDVKSIDNASQEQKAGIGQINDTITSLNSISQSSSQMAQNLFTSFNQLNELTTEMNSRVENLTK